MDCDFTSLAGFGLERAADLLTRGFADYFVRIPCTVPGLLEMARTDSVDLTASRVVVRGGAAVGAALIARRGWTSRLAAMALIPESRRQGVGRALVDRLLAEARSRGERTMVLEVIEQNDAATKFYETCGFRKIRRLMGFSAKLDLTGNPMPAVCEIDPREVAAALMTNGPADLPWQLSPETVAHLAPPAIGYRGSRAWLALSNPSGPQIGIRALVAERGGQGRGRAVELLQAVMAMHPGREWRISALWPEEFGEVFLAAGFTRAALSQWQMARALS